MTKKRIKKNYADEKIREIIAEYDRPGLVGPINYGASNGYFDNDKGYLFPRLERAATNQSVDGDATITRYALWAKTVHDLIVYAIINYKNEKPSDGEDLLVKAANSLAAFSEIQFFFEKNKSSNELGDK